MEPHCSCKGSEFAPPKLCHVSDKHLLLQCKDDLMSFCVIHKLIMAVVKVYIYMHIYAHELKDFKNKK